MAFQERFGGGYDRRIPDDAAAVISVPGGKFRGRPTPVGYSPKCLEKLSEKGTSDAPSMDLVGRRKAKWTEKCRFVVP